jgi:hypothetical protein
MSRSLMASAGSVANPKLSPTANPNPKLPLTFCRSTDVWTCHCAALFFAGKPKQKAGSTPEPAF